jgi:GYF domain 2
MSNRSWFFASNGQQQGPFPEAQFRDLIARGTVTRETLVWSEGMAGWQKAGAVPGLMAAGSAPPAMPPGGAMMGGGGYSGGAGGEGGAALSLDIGIWGLLGRSLLMMIGLLLIIPAPWVATMLYRYVVEHVRVPGRSRLTFTGQVGDIWWVFVLLGICSYSGATDYPGLQLVAIPLEAYLSWVTLRWIASNIAADGHKLPIEFKGSLLGYMGWYVLMMISFITIIGWAWVITAWMRWNCRNIAGTNREVIFTASGLEMLWRSFVFALACAFIIPIPWMLRWYASWYTSQISLVEPGSYANA